MSIYGLIDERALGEFPISVPTSIVVESAILGIVPEHMQGKARPLGSTAGYDSHYFSVKTMIRNIVSSIGQKNITTLMREEKAIAELVIEEMTIIREIYTERGSGCVPIFYIHDHKGFYRNKTNFKKLRKPRGNALLVERYIGEVVKKLLKHPDIMHVNGSFKRTEETSLITTHYVFELLEHAFFKRLVLVESHTGATKPKELWYTKYANYTEDPRYTLLPFIPAIYYIMGDKHTLQPWKKKVRERLLDIAKLRNFKPTMSESKAFSVIRTELFPTLDVRYQ